MHALTALLPRTVRNLTESKLTERRRLTTLALALRSPPPLLQWPLPRRRGCRPR
jgi:hypothetical protein